MAGSHLVSLTGARAAWLHAQGLDVRCPFGHGPDATRRAVEHLGYVQIDTINVVERSHHHILHTRNPGYARADLERAQSADKSVFEYWTHALAYIGTSDYRFFLPMMEQFRVSPHPTFSGVDAKDYAALLVRIRDEGPLSIRDIDDDVLVEKTHPWGSRKPSKRALRLGFFTGDLAISKRSGMVKTYDLADRHFAWSRHPKPASAPEFAEYLLRRALRSQGIVSLESICYGNLKLKAELMRSIDAEILRRRLVPIQIAGFPKVAHWAEPSVLDRLGDPPTGLHVHILSPFDPLVIQRRRLSMLFGYEHRFEAYIAAAKRLMGYFALPILVGDEFVAAIDLKADRQVKKLQVQKWTWLVQERPDLRALIDEALSKFESFQFQN